ncbi:group-specific protein [Burkholderia anthina]|uniref:group-specific protein n=1 Tax=Burkholderia anthina TaxID=179879 RepID=UPI0012DA9E66|nr:group-specific protein [Burkholderia anthina]
MTNLEEILGPASPKLLDRQYVVAVARHDATIHWLLTDHDNLVLDWKKWRDEFVAAGYQVPDQSATAPERSGIVVVDENSVEGFLAEPVTRRLSIDFLRSALLERFQNAKSWWDVGFLFPIAFVDFDNKRFAGFYYNGPRLERYIPDGWTGEFVDFANTYSEQVFPTADKFWIVDGRDLLHELNERGRAQSLDGAASDHRN